jgi:hypothetical protein
VSAGAVVTAVPVLVMVIALGLESAQEPAEGVLGRGAVP